MLNDTSDSVLDLLLAHVKTLGFIALPCENPGGRIAVENAPVVNFELCLKRGNSNALYSARK